MGALEVEVKKPAARSFKFAVGLKFERTVGDESMSSWTVRA